MPFWSGTPGTDAAADRSGILETVTEPRTDALEAIGGTGDIITGLLAGLTGAGQDLLPSVMAAIRISRMAGQAADPNPGTQVADIIQKIPDCLKQFYDNRHSTGSP